LYEDVDRLLDAMEREPAFLEADVAVLEALCDMHVFDGIMKTAHLQTLVYRCTDYGLLKNVSRAADECADDADVSNDFEEKFQAYLESYVFDLCNGMSAKSALVASDHAFDINIRAKEESGEGLLEWLEFLRNGYHAIYIHSIERFTLPEYRLEESAVPINAFVANFRQKMVFMMCKIFEGCTLAGFGARFPNTTAFEFVQSCEITRKELALYVSFAKAEIALIREYRASIAQIEQTGRELLDSTKQFSKRSHRLKEWVVPTGNALERSITAGRTAGEKCETVCAKLSLHLERFRKVLAPALSGQVTALQQSALLTIGKTFPLYVVLDIFNLMDHLAYGRFDETELIELIKAATQRATAVPEKRRRSPSPVSATSTKRRSAVAIAFSDTTNSVMRME
jgi:hypothetical protein